MRTLVEDVVGEGEGEEEKSAMKNILSFHHFQVQMTSYSSKTRAYVRLSPQKRSTRRRATTQTFNSVKILTVGLFSGALIRSMRLVFVR
jgi:hypothetical protein